MIKEYSTTQQQTVINSDYELTLLVAAMSVMAHGSTAILSYQSDQIWTVQIK
jgi:hypothetical protein